MAGIYRIWNIENNKSYIGQTTKKFTEERIAEHFRNFKYPSMQKIVLYKAMNKYGIECFESEILEEGEFSQVELDDMEKKYILKYNSYHNGYNATLGGDKNFTKKDYDVQQILKDYEELGSCRKVGLKHSLFHETVSKILKDNGVEIKARGRGSSKPCLVTNMKTGEILKFENQTKAADWFISENISSSKKRDSVRRTVKSSIYNKKPIFGWYLVEKAR